MYLASSSVKFWKKKAKQNKTNPWAYSQHSTTIYYDFFV